MAATDYWPEQDGIIVKGLVCGFCRADAAIAEGRIVAWGAGSGVGIVSVKSSAAVGDGIGVALKAATAAGDIIPVAFSGIIKMTTDETLSIGNLITNKSSLYIVGMGASDQLYINSKNSTIMGCTMQGGGDEQDELLVMLGGDGLAHGNV
jgi:hypothetical protein